jgi:CBS domain-containing protein
MLVKDVHSIPVVAKADDTVYDAIVSMFVNDVNALIIVRDDAILDGMVSQKDLLKSILGKPDLQKLPVSVVMTRKKNIITAYPDETVLSAAKKMIDYDVNCLPVVRSVAHDEDDSLIEVVGRISKTNIARVLVEIGSGR